MKLILILLLIVIGCEEKTIINKQYFEKYISNNESTEDIVNTGEGGTFFTINDVKHALKENLEIEINKYNVKAFNEGNFPHYYYFVEKTKKNKFFVKIKDAYIMNYYLLKN